MTFPPAVAEKALVACGRCCCLCHKFCGTKIELHHIKQEKDDGEDTFENCIPLCFDCHAEVQHYNPDHPKGRKFSDSELLKHRENWYEKMRSGAFQSVSGEHRKMDCRLFSAIRKQLAHSVDFLKNQDFEIPFEVADFRRLRTFVRDCSKPEKEFMDATLDSLRAELVASVDKLLDALAQHTFPAKRAGENELPHEWIHDQPARYFAALDEVRSNRHLAVKAYDEFIKNGRRILAVD